MLEIGAHDQLKGLKDKVAAMLRATGEFGDYRISYGGLSLSDIRKQGYR